MDSTDKRKTPAKDGRIKIVAADEHARVLVPVVLDPVRVELAIVRVAVEVGHVQVTIGVASKYELYKMPSNPPSFEFSQDCI